MHREEKWKLQKIDWEANEKAKKLKQQNRKYIIRKRLDKNVIRKINKMIESDNIMLNSPNERYDLPF